MRTVLNSLLSSVMLSANIEFVMKWPIVYLQNSFLSM